ncbi:uncharacterized protein LOC128154726 [Harpia harpyja]|uniref:uncharacterized protein LOC128154726 n=1 Tax=Harpia harpyja TaxID=202280 RepID=UPI0022B173E0|nr:uncharacterized protein LOC128154726 [Harpia harpyja]
MVVSGTLWFAASQGCWAEHPVVLTMTRGAVRRCLGEDALRAIRPPPREACLSLSAFLSVLQAKDALEARAHSPSLHSEPAAAICQLLLFPKKKKNPATDPGLSGSERPRLQGRGNGSSVAEGRTTPSLLALFAPLSYIFGWDCGCAGAGVVLSQEPAGWRWSPKDVGGFAVNREHGPKAELLARAPWCSSCSCLGGGGGLGKRTWKHPSVGFGNSPPGHERCPHGLSITRHRTGMCPSRAQPCRDTCRGTPLASLLEDER